MRAKETKPKKDPTHKDIFDAARNMSVAYKTDPNWGVVCSRRLDGEENENLWAYMGCKGLASMAACAAGQAVPQDGEWIKCTFDPQQCGQRTGTFEVEPRTVPFENPEEVPDGACLHFGSAHSSVKGSIGGMTYIAEASADASSWWESDFTLTEADLTHVEAAGVYTVEQSSKQWGYPTGALHGRCQLLRRIRVPPGRVHISQ